MSDCGEPIPGAVPAEVAQNAILEDSSPPKSSVDEIAQPQKKDIPLRDRLMAEMEVIVTEADDTKRGEQAGQFIEKRVAELMKLSRPTTLSLVNGSVYKGFIHPETRIMRSFIVDAVRINNTEIYKVLLESFRQFKENPAWQSKSMREIAQHALVRTLGTYFGNYYGAEGVESRNRQFYLDHSGIDSEDIAISEFRGKGMGVCAEKAAVAQNLLTFMGYDSELVMSTNNKLNSPDVNDRDGHAYNVISSDRGHFVHDPTNPVIVENTDGSLHTVLPSNYPISEEQYQNLVKGGQVEVDHNDLTWDGNVYKKQEDTKRVYGGPK